MRNQAAITQQQPSCQPHGQTPVAQRGKRQRYATMVLALIVTALCLGLFGCGGGDSEPAEAPDSGSTQSDTSSTAATEDTDASDDYSSWREFMKDYEAWVDSYIAFLEKYKENPNDASLASEASQMAEEASNWAQRLEAWSLDDMPPDELSEFMGILEQINRKLAAIR